MAAPTQLDILIAIATRLEGMQDAIGSIREASSAASGLAHAFETGFGVDIVRRFTDALREIPTVIKDALEDGVRFQAQIQQTQTAIAGLLRQSAPSFYKDFETANAAAADTIDALKKKANELGVSYDAMFESFEHAQAQLSSAGITDIQKQIDLVALLNRSMQALGVNATQASRDIGDILQGQASRTLGGPRLAAVMGMTKEELDQWVLDMKQSGTLAEGFAQKLSGIQEASKAMGDTFSANLERMRNALTELEGKAAQPIIAPLTDAIQSITETLTSSEVLPAFQNLGNFVAALVQGFADLTKSISGAVETLAQFASMAGTLSGNPLLSVLGKAGATQGDLQSNNTSIAIQKETETIVKQIASTGDDIAKQTEVRLALESEIMSVKARIASLSGIDLQQVQGNLNVLEDELTNFNKRVSAGAKITAQIQDQGKLLEARKKILDDLALKEANASGDPGTIAAARANKAYDETLRILGDVKGVKKENVDLADAEYNATYREVYAQQILKGSRSENRDLQKEITELAKQEELALANTKQQMSLIESNPFLTGVQKNAADAQLIPKAIADLNSQISALKAAQAGTPLDSTEWLQLQQRIQQAQVEVVQLGYKFSTLNFGGTVREDVTKWASQFIDAGHQVSTFITGTLNTAIGGLSNAITGLIFHTTTWKQAFASAVQSIVQGLITMVLQFAVARLAMFIINQIFGSQDASAATSQASAAAAAWAPAATSASIASYGVAAGVGTAAYIAALAAGIAAATGASAVGSAAGHGGFMVGGYTGSGPTTAIAGVVHGGEHVQPAHIVSRYGVELFEAFRHGQVSPADAQALMGRYRVATSAPRFGGFSEGGSVATGALAAGFGKIDLKVLNFTDLEELKKEVANSDMNKTVIIHTVNSNRHQVGIAA